MCWLWNKSRKPYSCWKFAHGLGRDNWNFFWAFYIKRDMLLESFNQKGEQILYLKRHVLEKLQSEGWADSVSIETCSLKVSNRKRTCMYQLRHVHGKLNSKGWTVSVSIKAGSWKGKSRRLVPIVENKMIVTHVSWRCTNIGWHT